MNELTQELINFCNFKLEDCTSSVMYKSSHAQARTCVHVTTFLLLIIWVLIFHLRLYQCEQFIHKCYYYINLRTNRLVFYCILYNDQQMHNYFTNYHIPTSFDTIASSSGHNLASTTVASTYRLYIRPPHLLTS